MSLSADEANRIKQQYDDKMLLIANAFALALARMTPDERANAVPLYEDVIDN